MSHSKLFGFTCWMVALAGVFGGGLYLLFDSGVSADLNIESMQWLEVAISDLFALSMIASLVGFALMFASLISSLSTFFTARAEESSVLMELDREFLAGEEEEFEVVKPVAAKEVSVEKKTSTVKKSKPAKKRAVAKKK